MEMFGLILFDSVSAALIDSSVEPLSVFL